MSDSPITARFAPSPTGISHAGNIFTYLCTWLMAKSMGGEVVLRIEDLDTARSRPEYARAVIEMFEETGLNYDRGPYYQSDNTRKYRLAVEEIASIVTVYPCFCTRRDLAFQSAPHAGDAPAVYDRRCLQLNDCEVTQRTSELALEGRRPSYRLLADSREIGFTDLIKGCRKYVLDKDCGDFVIRRADEDFAYNLAVVVDDMDEGVNFVSRGCDLLDCTPAQIYIQQLLGGQIPTYAHFPLIVAKDGRRLAKRDQDATYDALKHAFGSPEGVIGHIAHMAGLQKYDEPATPEELLKTYEDGKIEGLFANTDSIEFRQLPDFP